MPPLVTRSMDGAVQSLEHERIRPCQPGTEFYGIQPLRQFAKPIQVEAAVRNSEAYPGGVNRIDFLLDMILDWHEEQRFAEIGGFGDGLESGCAGHVFAIGH